MAVLRITSREFRDKQKSFLDLADKGEQIIIRRGKKKAYKLFQIEDDDTPDIAEEYKCNPYIISPSGDPFWADKRNVEELDKQIEEAKQDIKEGKTFEMLPNESLSDFLKRTECTK